MADDAVCVWDVNNPTRTTSPQLVLRGHTGLIYSLTSICRCATRSRETSHNTCPRMSRDCHEANLVYSNPIRTIHRCAKAPSNPRPLTYYSLPRPPSERELRASSCSRAPPPSRCWKIRNPSRVRKPTVYFNPPPPSRPCHHPRHRRKKTSPTSRRAAPRSRRRRNLPAGVLSHARPSRPA